MSKLEALIDFSDEELPLEFIIFIFNNKILNLLEEMKKSFLHSNYGERIRNGFVVTINRSSKCWKKFT